MADVISKGCVIDGFPYKPSQAIALANKSLLPSPVFYLSCPNEQLPTRLKKKFKHDPRLLQLQNNQILTFINETASWYQNTYENLKFLSTEHSKWWVKDNAIDCINQVFKASREYSIAVITKKPVKIKHLPITRKEINQRFGKFKRYDPILYKYKNELKEIKSNDYLVEYNTKIYAFESSKNLEVFLESPDKIVQSKNLPDSLPRKLLLSECGDIYESRIELEANCVVSLAEEGKLVKGVPTILVSYGEKIFTFLNRELCEKYMKKPHRYEKTKIPVKIPPKADNIVNFVLEDFESSVGFLDQMLGQVIIKALLEVGSQKLLFPLLSPKETALKHFSLFLKAHNSKNTVFEKEKYSKKLWEFKQICSIQGELYEEGVRKENNELKDWEIGSYFAKGEKYEEFLAELSKNIDSYIDKLIR